MRKRWSIRVARFAAIAAVAITVFSFVVMNLWNWLVPPIFGWHAITFGQAIGLGLEAKRRAPKQSKLAIRPDEEKSKAPAKKSGDLP